MSSKKKAVSTPPVSTRVMFKVGERIRPTKVGKYYTVGDFGDCRAIEKFIAQAATRPYALEVDSERRIGVWTIKSGQLAGMKSPAKSIDSSIPEIHALIEFINEG